MFLVHLGVQHFVWGGGGDAWEGKGGGRHRDSPGMNTSDLGREEEENGLLTTQLSYSR